jgi:type II secretory pathway component PulC
MKLTIPPADYTHQQISVWIEQRSSTVTYMSNRVLDYTKEMMRSMSSRHVVIPLHASLPCSAAQI